MSVRVRYAPSPTGHLHIGGVRTALFNFLFAQHNNGDFILRFEDTDLDRNVPGAEEEMLKGFRWLGFEWSEGPDIGGPYGPYRCTERLETYQSHLTHLLAEHYAYPCFCTAEEIERDREQAMADGRTSKYSGRCRHLSDADRQAKLDAGVPHSWRFAVPEGMTFEVNDLVRGHVQFEAADSGDFVIVKSNGMPTYNFQVVIDDALMEISHVIRGEEHLSNTPRQLMIYHAFGWEPPQFAHLPQVLNENRKKLSKRDPDVLPVHAYREQGYLPEAIVNFLALLGWSPGGEEELFALESIAKQFDFQRVSKSGAVFDVNKLHWMAAQYMKQAETDKVTAMVQEDLQRRGIEIPNGRNNDWLRTLVALYQEKMACVADFAELTKGFFHEAVEWDEEAAGVMTQDNAPEVIQAYLELAEADTEEWTVEASRARFKQVQKNLGVKGRGLFMPVRAALTGEVHGPDLQQTVVCLTKPWVVNRLKRALEFISARA